MPIDLYTLDPGSSAHRNQHAYYVVGGVLLAFATYLFISILFCLLKPYAEKVVCGYKLKNLNKSRKNVDDSNSVSCEEPQSTNNGARVQQKRIRKRANLTMISLTLTMSLIVLIRVTVDFWAYMEKNSFSIRAQCVRHTVSGLMYLASALCLYVFLWIRQRAFYAHPVLKHLARPWIVKFSWSVLATIVAVIFFSAIIFFLPQIAPMPGTEDVKTNDTILRNTTIPMRIDFVQNGIVPIQCGFQRKAFFLAAHFLITMAFLYFQISLQFLFGYPIFKQRRGKQRSPTCPKSNDMMKPPADTAVHIASNRCSPSSKASHIMRLSSFPGTKTTNNNPKSDDHDVQVDQRDAEILNPNLNDAKALFSSVPNLAKSDHDRLLVTMVNKDYNAASRVTEQRGCAGCKADVRSEDGMSHHQSREKKYGIHKISSAITGRSFKDIRLIPKSLSNATERSRKSLQRRLKLRKYVMRCLCVSAICFISDIATFFFVYFSQIRENPEAEYEGSSAVTESLLTSLAYNTNMLLNLLCMIACYKDWRCKLCPWYYVIKKATLTKGSQLPPSTPLNARPGRCIYARHRQT